MRQYQSLTFPLVPPLLSARLFFLAVLLAFNVSAGYPQRSSAAPLAECWRANVENIDKLEIESDNTNRIFFSYNGGGIASANAANGEPTWKTELGGQTLRILYDQGILYVASLYRDEAKAPALAADRQSVTLRALSADTGIVKWQTVLKNTNSKGDVADETSGSRGISGVTSIISHGDKILFVGHGEIAVVLKTDGKQIENAKLGGQSSTRAFFSDQELYVGTAAGNLAVYSIATRAVSQIPTYGRPTALTVFDGKIVVGDGLGRLTAYDIKSKKREWQTRTGAEIANITASGSGVVASSNDNFLYFIVGADGSKRWKKRLDGRNTTVSDASADLLLAVNLNGNVAALIEPRKGRTVNQIIAPAASFFIGKPILANKTVIFHLNDGLLAYSPTNCSL